MFLLAKTPNDGKIKKTQKKKYSFGSSICTLLEAFRYSSVDTKPTSRDECRSHVRFPARARDLSIFHNVKTGSEVQPASYAMGTRTYIPSGNVTGA
jgi:hypothetical protein